MSDVVAKVQALYMDLMLDFVFKIIFKPSENWDLLEDLVNTLLFPDGEKHLTIVSIIDPETLPRTKESRFAIIDLHCAAESGERVLVEIQKVKHPNFSNRILINEAHVTLDQVPKGTMADGSPYDFRLSPMYFLSICDFRLTEEKDNPNRYRHEIVKTNKETGKVFSRLINEVYVELPKFTKKPGELNTRTEQWLYLFKHLAEDHMPPSAEEDPLLRKVREHAYLANKTKEEMNTYEREKMKERVYLTSISYAKDEGIDIGEKRGLAIAAALVAGQPVEQIAQDFDLTIEEVLAIKQDLGL